MTASWILAFAAYLCLVAFLGTVIWFVPHLDLIAVTVTILALAFYDLLDEMKSRRR